jgi:hypothetical protein
MSRLASLLATSFVATAAAAPAQNLHLDFQVRPSFGVEETTSFDSSGPAPLVEDAGSVRCFTIGEFSTGGCGQVDAGTIGLFASVVAEPDDPDGVVAEARGSFSDSIAILCGGQACRNTDRAKLKAEIKGSYSPAIVNPWDEQALSFVSAGANLRIQTGPFFALVDDGVFCTSLGQPPCLDLETVGGADNQNLSKVVELSVGTSPFATSQFTVLATASARATAGFECPDPDLVPCPFPLVPSETGPQVVFMNLRGLLPDTQESAVRWLGIEVRDLEGNLVPNVTAISPTSGIDWAQPAPEPLSGLLELAALAGLGLLGRVRRRRRNCPAPRSTPT